MEDIKKIFRELMILEQACLDEQTVQIIVQLVEKLLKLVGNIFTNNGGLHALEFDELIEKDFTEIKHKIEEIKQITFEAYRQI